MLTLEMIAILLDGYESSDEAERLITNSEPFVLMILVGKIVALYTIYIYISTCTIYDMNICVL